MMSVMADSRSAISHVMRGKRSESDRFLRKDGRFDVNRPGTMPSASPLNARAATERETAPSPSTEADDFAGAEVARSRRLRLSGLRYADIPELSRLYARTMMYPLLVESPTRFIDVAAQVARIHRCYAELPGLGMWRADTHDGRFIGTFSLLPVDDADEVQVGVRLIPEIWGRWYAIEGGHLLCRQAFESLGLPRLLGYCRHDHLTARRVLERFGFHDMGTREDPSGLIHRYELHADTWREARRLYT
jgi:RimJ/RimL family protein N-acetyltransferase